jgi:hypothetical protein
MTFAWWAVPEKQRLASVAIEAGFANLLTEPPRWTD